MVHPRRRPVLSCAWALAFALVGFPEAEARDAHGPGELGLPFKFPIELGKLD